ncbi:hypothetical protein ACHQM5_015079 [Ranunculus cassubicifolius]
MSNITGDSRSFSSGEDELQQQLHHKQLQQQQQQFSEPTRTDNSNGSTSHPQAPPAKKKRNLPGTPDPSAEVIALSPTTLMATNRFICEICNKGFQRDQNLQLHRRGHNLPWKLKQRTSAEIRKRVYICPETTCVHHNPARALGDLTGIKKHFCRKHGEKKWKCDKCAKKYAVQSDWKAHSKTCGTREYKCDCGTIFSRRDSFITHRAFCDALAEENNKVSQGVMPNVQGQISDFMTSMPINNPTSSTPLGMSEYSHNADTKNPLKSLPLTMAGGMFSNNSAGGLYNGLRSSSCLQLSPNNSSSFDGLHDSKSNQQIGPGGSAHMSATALLQKAAQMGATASSNVNSPMMQKSFVSGMSGPNHGPYGGLNLYDNMQSQQTDQSQLVGIDGGSFINQFLHNKAPQEMSSQFVDTASGVDDDMGAFSGIFMSGGGGDQHHGFLKTTENENGNTNKPSGTSTFQGKPSRNPAGPSRFSGGGGGGDVLTVDFLGVGGSRSANVHEQHHHPHHHQQEQPQEEEEDELEFDDRIQGLHQYQQQVSQGQTAMEKPMWDV